MEQQQDPRKEAFNLDANIHAMLAINEEMSRKLTGSSPTEEKGEMTLGELSRLHRPENLRQPTMTFFFDDTH